MIPHGTINIHFFPGVSRELYYCKYCFLVSFRVLGGRIASAFFGLQIILFKRTFFVHIHENTPDHF